METFKLTCDKLNKILENRPENQEEFINKINEILYNEVIQCGGGLYWNRELFIDCGTDELCRKMIFTNKVMFVPTNDLIEHPGITLTYKPEFSRTNTFPSMKPTNHEAYGSFEVAKLLRESGFDWECRYCYDAETKDFLDDNEGEFNFNEGDDNNFYSAPTLDVAQRWLREVKNIQIIASPLAGSKKWTPLICKDFQLLHEDLDGISLTPENFDSYELALESGIKKALEMILEKGE